MPRPAGLRAPLLLMVDQEGGSVKRLPGAPVRSAPQMAATGSPSVAHAEGRATARTLRAAGMNVDLAPVVDVVRPESALHSEGRGFGFSAGAASRFGTAFAAGLGEGRVAAAAKHFPGFGAAVANTDNGAVRIPVDRDTLQRVDRRPFVAARRAHVPMVMLASAIYPALSPKPAVLSRAVVQGQLRRAVGFRGVTISDDLAAPAFAAHGGRRRRRRAGRARRRRPAAVRRHLRGRRRRRRRPGGGDPRAPGRPRRARAGRGADARPARAPALMLLLFDIDGTLLLKASMAHAAAVHEALATVYGVGDPPRPVEAAGKTDLQIAREICVLAEVDAARFDAGPQRLPHRHRRGLRPAVPRRT